MNKYFELVPIEEKPEESGRYVTLIIKDENAFSRVEYNDFDSEEREQPWTSKKITHWLRPYPEGSVLLTQEQVREIEDKAYTQGYNDSATHV